jgi:hypothetical protein
MLNCVIVRKSYKSGQSLDYLPYYQSPEIRRHCPDQTQAQDIEFDQIYTWRNGF